MSVQNLVWVFNGWMGDLDVFMHIKSITIVKTTNYLFSIFHYCSCVVYLFYGIRGSYIPDSAIYM